VHLSRTASYLSNKQEELRERPLYISHISVVSNVIPVYLYTIETGEVWIAFLRQNASYRQENTGNAQ
jgi:hypothetical protein